MAKSKPIGVRFDLEKLELIQKEQNLTSAQSVLNYLMDNYGKTETKRGAPFKNMPPYNRTDSNLPHKVFDGKINAKFIQVPQKELKNGNHEPPEGLTGIDLVIWKSENCK
jgi:protein tyrosine phosphatase